MYLSVGDFKFATCIPDTCTYGDGAINAEKMWSSFNATAYPMVEMDDPSIWSEIPTTEKNKRHEMDNFAISIM